MRRFSLVLKKILAELRVLNLSLVFTLRRKQAQALESCQVKTNPDASINSSTAVMKFASSQSSVMTQPAW